MEEKEEEELDTQPTTFFECKEEKEGWEIKTWIEEQSLAEKETDNFKLMFKKARTKGDKRFTISKGLLVKIESEERRRQEGRKEKVVVPESLKAFVLGQHHNLELHGHQGRRRTEIMIGSRYYWPGMSKDIRRWILACSGCSKRKKARPMSAGLTDINQATRPWQTVGIDIVGELPLTSRGNKWILTMVDHFTRWPIAIPIPDRESATIAKAIFDNLVTVHGPPQTILSDQGRELISKGMETLCSRWGIRKVKTGGYNPTGNANCERFHKYLNSSMTIVRNKQTPSDWDEYLQAVLFSYRCSVNDATGYSPYFLLNGRTPTIPSDLSFDILEPEYKGKEDYVQKMVERLRTAFSLARRQQYAAAVENEDRGGNKSKPDYKPGDLLFVWARNSEESRTERADGKTVALPKKWVNPWIGPYKLIRWTSERKCLLDCAGKEQEFIVNRLSKHNRWDEVNPSTYAWTLKSKTEETNKPVEEKAIEVSPPKEEREIFGRDYVFEKGEIIVFEQLESEAYNIPFGLGVVLEHTKGMLVNFQWMGNSLNNEKGKWDLCWYQENEAKIYYSSRPLHKNHSPNSGIDTETRIKPDDVIMSSRGKTDILHLDKSKDSTYRRLTTAAKKVIEENPYVIEARQRMQNPKLKQKEMSASENERGKRKRKGDSENEAYSRKK
jgi:transposase InsO family protein